MTSTYPGERATLVDLVDRLIGCGVALNGDVVLSLAGIDLVYLGLRSVLAPAHVVPPEKQLLGHVEAEPGQRQAGRTARSRELPESAEPRDGFGAGTGRDATRSIAAPDESALGGDSGRQPAPRSSSETLPQSAGTDDPEEIQRGLVQLVLTLVEVIRQVMERQAIRRVEAGGLDDDQVERLGEALMLLESAMADLRERFGFEAEDLNLDLGPLGRLL